MTSLKKEQAKLRGSITRCFNCVQVGDDFDYDAVNADYKKLLEVEIKLFSDGIPDNEQKKVEDYTRKMAAIRKARGILKDPAKPLINFKHKEIPKFSGEFQDWRVFKAVFDEMVTNNPECDMNNKKRHLLRVCSGEAADLIKPYLSDTNAFSKMMTALTDYYDSSDKAKENILSAIRKLPFLTSKLDENVKEFKNKALIIVKQVQEITPATDEFRKVIRNELLARMHYNLRDLFYSGGKYSTMQDVLTLLQKCYNERELRIECKELHPESSSKPKAMGAVANQNSSQTKKCAFCHGDHFTASCNEQMEAATRRSIASDNKLCFNCLKPGHSVLRCSSNKTCKECRRKHHTLLHENRGIQPASNTSQQQSNQSQATGASIAVVESVTSKWPIAGVATSFRTSAEKTKKPLLTGEFNGKRVKMLLDGGGDQTMILRALIHPDAIVRGQPKNFFGVGGKCHSYEMVRFQVLCENKELIEITAYVVENLPGGIDILLGNDQLHKVSPDEELTENKQLRLPTKICGDVYYSGTIKDQDKATVAIIEAQKLAPAAVFQKSSSENSKKKNNESGEFEINQMDNGRYEVALPTKDNPADDVSRPLTVDQSCTIDLKALAESADIHEIPRDEMVAITSAAPARPTSKAVGAMQTTLEPLKGFESNKDRSALIKDVKTSLAIKADKDHVDPPETVDVFDFISKTAQGNAMEELDKLDSSGRPCYTDQGGIIRMKTRIKDEPGQVWIPATTIVSNLVIEAERNQSNHDGKRFTKAVVSTNYYIHGLSSKVHHIIKQCLECQRKWRSFMSRPSRPPDWACIYERMVGTVKRSMSEIRNSKSALELRYAIAESVGIVNSSKTTTR